MECGVVLGSAFGVQLFGGDNKESRWAGFAPIRRGRGLAFKVCGYNPVSVFPSNFKYSIAVKRFSMFSIVICILYDLINLTYL